MMEITATTKWNVIAALRHWFGTGQVLEIVPLDPECFQARLAGGGIALATVEDDGSISIHELDVDGVC